MAIQFTQFLKPNGRRIPSYIERPPEIETAAHKLVESGCRFEIEVLRTGEISLECCRTRDDDEIETLSAEIVDNGPDVPTAVDRLVMAAEKAARGEVH